MSVGSTSPVARPAPQWATYAAGLAVAFALAAMVPLLFAIPWSALFINGPYLSVILGVAVLAATRRARPSNARFMAWMALAATAGWVLLLILFGLALRLA